jgi:hypothetical protein
MAHGIGLVTVKMAELLLAVLLKKQLHLYQILLFLISITKEDILLFAIVTTAPEPVPEIF